MATVAIVGRPNVGKSTLFNRLAGKRISIVEDTPGVTRDRIYAEVEWTNKKFTMIDTGGIEVNSEDTILRQVKLQAEVAIDTAEVIVFVVDTREGLTTTDEEVADLLRKSGKPVILVGNKTDNAGTPDSYYDFFALGFGEPILVSAEQALGLGDLLDEILFHLGDVEEMEYDEDVIKVAVIGKPNAGKSSIINRILGEQRVIVSDIPGTTRDAVDTPFTMDGQKYVFIDTAGIRKKSKVNEALERFTVLRALKAIERSDVAMLIVDAVEGITEQDKKIVGYAHNEGRAIIIVVNKWDIYEKDTNSVKKYSDKIYLDELPFLQYAPIMFVSALTGKRVDKLIGLISFVANQHSRRIPTAQINNFILDIMSIMSPPSDKGRQLKIYYGTQPLTRPPTFVFFVNDPELVHFSYKRYIENNLRKTFGFEGTPIIIKFQGKKERK